MYTLACISVMMAISYAASKPSTSTNATDIEAYPGEVRKFYGSLNTEEKVALKKYVKELKEGSANFSLTDDLVGGIKSGSEGLTNKLAAFRDLINSRLDGLSPESRGFITEMIRKLIILIGEGDGLMDILMSMKNYGADVLRMYDSLSEKTRQDLLKGFPTIGAIATSDIARVILNRLADYTPSVTWGSTPSTHDEPDQPAKKAFTHEPPTRPPHSIVHSSMYPAVSPNPSSDDTAGEEEMTKVKLID